MAEFTGVEGRYCPTPLEGGSGDDQIVGADHLARGGELRPDFGMRASHPNVDRNYFQAPKEFFDPPTTAAGAGRVRFNFKAKPQFAEGDDADRYRLRWPRT